VKVRLPLVRIAVQPHGPVIFYEEQMKRTRGSGEAVVGGNADRADAFTDALREAKFREEPLFGVALQRYDTEHHTHSPLVVLRGIARILDRLAGEFRLGDYPRSLEDIRERIPRSATHGPHRFKDPLGIPCHGHVPPVYVPVTSEQLSGA
jgi:hypothetical protein